MMIAKQIRIRLIHLVLLMGILVLILGFQNCSKDNFSAASSGAVSAAQTSNPAAPAPAPSPSPSPAPPPSSGGDNGGGGVISPSCVPTSTNTPIVSSLPSGVTSSMIAQICPSVGQDSECGVVIIVSDNGLSLYYTGQGPYDRYDDTLVGVLNLSSSPVASLNLSSNMDIMGFDNDGLDTYNIAGTRTKVPGNAMDNSGYGGPNTYYTNISRDDSSGTANFVVPVAANGGTTYFSLENALTSTSTCLTTTAN